MKQNVLKSDSSIGWRMEDSDHFPSWKRPGPAGRAILEVSASPNNGCISLVAAEHAPLDEARPEKKASSKVVMITLDRRSAASLLDYLNKVLDGG